MKPGILITVRTGSTRLPKKALMEVNKRPIISYLIERIKRETKGRYKIVICTTRLEEDMVLQGIAKEYGVDFFQGDPENIIKRHLECAESFGFDFVVNVDGDDILCSPEYISEIIELAKDTSEYEVIKTAHLPLGMNVMGYEKSVLEKILFSITNEKIDTGWGQLINDENKFKIYKFPGKGSEILEARLTLDYEEDFGLFKSIIENFLVGKSDAKTSDIIEYLKLNSVLIEKNIHLNEVYWHNYYSKRVKEG